MTYNGRTYMSVQRLLLGIGLMSWAVLSTGNAQETNQPAMQIRSQGDNVAARAQLQHPSLRRC